CTKRLYQPQRYDSSGRLTYEEGGVCDASGTKLYAYVERGFGYNGQSLSKYTQLIYLPDKSVLTLSCSNNKVTISGSLVTEKISIYRTFNNVSPQTKLIFARDGEDEISSDISVISPYERTRCGSYQIWTYSRKFNAYGNVNYEAALIKDSKGNILYRTVRSSFRYDINKKLTYYIETMVFADGHSLKAVFNKSTLTITGYYGGSAVLIKKVISNVAENERLIFPSKDYFILLNQVTGSHRILNLDGVVLNDCDGDCIPDIYDTDNDNDGIVDAQDTYPYDPLNNTFPIYDESGNVITLPVLTNNPNLSFYYNAQPGAKTLYTLTLTEGVNNFTVTRYDYKNNPISAAFSVMLDAILPEGKIVINRGGSGTNSSVVTLYLTATDSASGIDKVSFSNDGITYSDWEDFAPERSWQLSPGDGTKEIRYRIRDKAGNIAIYSATIILDTVPSHVVFTSPAITNNPDYVLTYTVGGVEKSRNFTLVQEGENILTVTEEECTYEYIVTLDTIGPEIVATSPYITYSPDYMLTYTVNSEPHQNQYTLEPGKTTFTISETDEVGNETVFNYDVYYVIPEQLDLALEYFSSERNNTSYAAINIIDGDVSYGHGWWSAHNYTPDAIYPQEFIIDLQGAYMVTEIIFDTHVDGWGTAPYTYSAKNVRVSATNNGEDWFELGDFILERDLNGQSFSLDGCSMPGGEATKLKVEILSGYARYSCEVAEITVKGIPAGFTMTSPLLTNEQNYLMTYSFNGAALERNFTLTEGENDLTITEYDHLGVEHTFNVTVTLDTVPPQLLSVDLAEGITVGVPYTVVTCEVDDQGVMKTALYEAQLVEGANTVDIVVYDAAGNPSNTITRNVTYTPVVDLEENYRLLRERFIGENARFFQEGVGIDPNTGFPVDFVYNEGASSASWTQPTSIGFYLEFLVNVITRRTDVDFLTQSNAIIQARKVLDSLLYIQESETRVNGEGQTEYWSFKGLIPWFKVCSEFKPDKTEIAILDNVNLTHSIACFLGALERANLHTNIATDIYLEAQTFLDNQREGYQYFANNLNEGLLPGAYYMDTGQFHASYRIDRFGSEIRASLPFIIVYFDLPSNFWENLDTTTNSPLARYFTQEGRVLETFSTWDGGGFQYFWPMLKAPEEEIAGVSGALYNAFLAQVDYMNRWGLPGFASASSLPPPYSGYGGAIGNKFLKERYGSSFEGVGSVYSLASAFRLAPEFVLSQLETIENNFPGIKGSLGFYDAARSSGEVSQYYYAIDQGAFLLGLLGYGAGDFKYWMENKGLWQTYENLYNVFDFGISQAYEELPEPPLSYNIYDQYVTTGDLYSSGMYPLNAWASFVIREETPEGTYRYTVNDPGGWCGGNIVPAINIAQYPFLTLQIRNVSGLSVNNIYLEMKGFSAYHEQITLEGSEWYTIQFFLPDALDVAANILTFAQPGGDFEVRSISFSNVEMFYGDYPPTVVMTSPSTTSGENYTLSYQLNGIAYTEPVLLDLGENTLTRIFHDPWGREYEYQFTITREL
ncbi:MAG: glucoamylase family protein, partial [Candidatus Omnitrophica bacterium]|nr:glucoamylase family protein [Candidatus Omnitrophota bacterium]